MKIYTKIRIDIATGKVLEEGYFGYAGPLAMCAATDAESDPTGENEAAEAMGWGGEIDTGGGEYNMFATNAPNNIGKMSLEQAISALEQTQRSGVWDFMGKGASVGISIGPVGAVIGAAVGALIGAFRSGMMDSAPATVASAISKAAPDIPPAVVTALAQKIVQEKTPEVTGGGSQEQIVGGIMAQSQLTQTFASMGLSGKALEVAVESAKQGLSADQAIQAVHKVGHMGGMVYGKMRSGWGEAVKVATAPAPAAPAPGSPTPAAPAPGSPADNAQRLSDLLNPGARLSTGGAPATGIDPTTGKRVPVPDDGMRYFADPDKYGGRIDPTTGRPIPATANSAPGFESAMSEFRNVNTDIKFIHDMSELEGVTLGDEEKKFLETMRVNATTNLTNTVNEATLDLAETEIARMVSRGVLQGNIGSETMSKIYEASGKIIGEQSRNIESDVAGMGLGILEQKKTNQMGLWGQELTADIASAGAGTDKWKSIGMLELGQDEQTQGWNQNLIQALTTMRGQDTSYAAAKLGAETNLSMANKEMDVWKDVNEQSNWANIGSALINAWW